MCFANAIVIVMYIFDGIMKLRINMENDAIVYLLSILIFA